MAKPVELSSSRSDDSQSTSLATGAATTGGEEAANCAPGEAECLGLCFVTSCEGEWQCHPEAVCDGELVAWCGCDGETFYAPSSCPSRAFQHVGECE